MISIVMSTYNGEKYITELLDSIRKQTIKIDEFIISDDLSTDATVEIVANYIEKYGLTNWTLIKNNINKGWKKNFAESLQLAKGDFIFPCDQDDIWMENKVELLSNILEKRKEIKLIASNYISFYDDTEMDKMVQTMDFSNEPYKIEFEKSFYVTRPGCVYGFKRELLGNMIKYWYEDYPHDAFLWRISAMLDGLYVVDYPTIFYRRHQNTATGREKKDLSYKIKDSKYYEQVLFIESRFCNEEEVQQKEKKHEIIQLYSKWIKTRLRLLEEKHILSAIKIVLYMKCYYSYKSFFADVYTILFDKKEKEQ